MSRLSSAFFQKGEEIIENPQNIFSLLGESVPGAGNFFIAYVALKVRARAVQQGMRRSPIGARFFHLHVSVRCTHSRWPPARPREAHAVQETLGALCPPRLSHASSFLDRSRTTWPSATAPRRTGSERSGRPLLTHSCMRLSIVRVRGVTRSSFVDDLCFA